MNGICEAEGFTVIAEFTEVETGKGADALEKAQGKQLGNPKLVAAATKRDKVLRPILQKLAGQSLRAIAAELDRRGIKSWSGKPWNAVSVRNAMVRLGFQTTGGRAP